MNVNGDNIVFSTGKVACANRGIIGLSEPDEDGWCVSGGYDGVIHSDYAAELSEEEKAELADYMISLWQRFKDNINARNL